MLKKYIRNKYKVDFYMLHTVEIAQHAYIIPIYHS